MRRGASLQTWRIALGVVLFLPLLSFGQRMSDCATHCQQKGTPGAHCPFMHPSPSRSKSSPHHCPMHQTAMQQRWELHCACSQQSPASSPELASFRFVLPHAVSFLVPPADVFRGRDAAIFFPEVALVPPDPPPRLFSLVSVP